MRQAIVAAIKRLKLGRGALRRGQVLVAGAALALPLGFGCAHSATAQRAAPMEDGNVVTSDDPIIKDTSWLTAPFEASKRRRKSVERLVRAADGTWRVEGEENAAIVAARAEFDAANELFRQENYSKAGHAFKRLASRYKDTPIEEESLFLAGECYYKLECFPRAQDIYAQLLTKYPTSRYLPQAVQRTYDIAFYWLEDSRLHSQGQPTKHSAFTNAVNLFDKTRPVLDTQGRALDAIQTIQQADPLGPLTDDAVMMAGAHTFVNEDYVKAAGYYEQVFTDQPKSEHADKALVLGSQAYLRAYSGPKYDGTDLDSAEKLIKAALARPSLSGEQKTRLEQDLRRIYLERAKRVFTAAEDYRRMRRPNGARYYYGLVIRKFPDTDWARRADEELKQLGPPDAASSRLATRTATAPAAAAEPAATPAAVTPTAATKPAAEGSP